VEHALHCSTIELQRCLFRRRRYVIIDLEQSEACSALIHYWIAVMFAIQRHGGDKHFTFVLFLRNVLILRVVFFYTFDKNSTRNKVKHALH